MEPNAQNTSERPDTPLKSQLSQFAVLDDVHPTTEVIRVDARPLNDLLPTAREAVAAVDVQLDMVVHSDVR